VLESARAVTARGVAVAGSRDLLEGIHRLADPLASLAYSAGASIGMIMSAPG
jgi:hypothetical protein